MNVVVRQEGESSLVVLIRDPIFQTHNTKFRKYDNYLLGTCQPFSDISNVKEESLCLPFNSTGESNMFSNKFKFDRSVK